MLRDPDKFKSGTAGLYGTAAAVPPEITQEVVGIYLDTASKATAPEHENDVAR